MSSNEINPQQRRENSDPHEQSNPIPWFVIMLVIALMSFGVIYIARSELNQPPQYGDGRTTDELSGKAVASGGAAGAASGKELYAARCAACHQAEGQGLPGVFPPLAGSEWVNGKEQTLAAIVLNGVVGPLTVKGSTYNGAMPNFAEQLNDDEIAAVLTFLRTQLGNQAAPVSANLVKTVREQTTGRGKPFDGDKDLNAMK